MKINLVNDFKKPYYCHVTYLVLGKLHENNHKKVGVVNIHFR